MQWMIYGANGYTGELLARDAAQRGLRPVLAGRNTAQLAKLAAELQLEYRVFALDKLAEIDEGLTGIGLVLHCAGPFSATSAAMIEGCLDAGAHYLDITGEAPVFEHTHAPVQNRRAKDRGVVLCSGVGFDVIPTDCVALKLKQLLPDATHLSLGFDTSSGLSPGTSKTMIEGMAQGCLERCNGKLVTVPLGSKQKSINFGRGPRWAMTIPWGDVSTAFYTTGIPNIDTWFPIKKSMARGARLMNLLRPLMATAWMQNRLKNLAARYVKGPDATTRARLPTYVWGEARNAAGVVKTVRIKTANGYTVTVDGALAIVSYLLANKPAGGSYTPAMLLGAELVERLPGSGKFDIG